MSGTRPGVEAVGDGIEIFLAVDAQIADMFKIGVSYLLGGLGFVACLYIASNYGVAKHLQVLLCILGGAFGWILGLYMSPSSQGEKNQFSEYGKAFAALVSGFGLAKLDPIISWINSSVSSSSADSIALRTLLLVTPILIGLQITYISRLHVRGKAADQKDRRAQVLYEVKEALNKLEKLS